MHFALLRLYGGVDFWLISKDAGCTAPLSVMAWRRCEWNTLHYILQLLLLLLTTYRSGYTTVPRWNGWKQGKLSGAKLIMPSDN